MKVEVEIKDVRHAGRPEGSVVVVTGASCPVCSDLDGVVDSGGRVVALAASAAGMAKALRDHRGCSAQASHDAGPLKVYSDEQVEQDRAIYGRAICNRCRHVIGRIVVWPDTIFGLEEAPGGAGARPGLRVRRAGRFRFPEANAALYLVIEAAGRANVGGDDDLASAAANLEAAEKLCRRAAEVIRAALAERRSASTRDDEPTT